MSIIHLRFPLLLISLLAAVLSACGPKRLDELTIRRVLEQGRHPYVEDRTGPAERRQLLELYEERDFSPLWSTERQPTAAALGLIRELHNAQLRGLAPEAYAGESLLRHAQALSSKHSLTSEDENASLFDVALSLAAIRFVSDVAIGQVSPRTFGYEL